MLDIRFIRENTDLVKQGIAAKSESCDIDRLLAYDKERRELLQKVEALRHTRKVVSDEIGQCKKEGKDAGQQIGEMQKVSSDLKEQEKQLNTIEKQLQELLIQVPNVPHPSVPVGRDESANIVMKEWGSRETPDFQIKDHLEIGERLGILDFQRGAKIAGSGFPLYIGLGAQLERALINFMLNLHIHKHGYTEVFTPFLANRESTMGTGQLPKLEEDMYYCDMDNLFLIPTAEVSVTNIHRNEIFPPGSLPVNYTAFSACFRREAGSYGKETRGFQRVHQFNKVEMVKFVDPETSYDELEALLQDAEEVLQLLELPYRVLTLASGDLSFAAAKCYDIEVWSPGTEKYLEVSSCSNFEDFQARRMQIRFRRKAGAKPEFIHTLNGSGVATARLMIAILEHYQTDEGTVIVPDVLREYMKKDVIK